MQKFLLYPVVAVVGLIKFLDSIQVINHVFEEDFLSGVIGDLPVKHLRDGLLLLQLYTLYIVVTAQGHLEVLA